MKLSTFLKVGLGLLFIKISFETIGVFLSIEDNYRFFHQLINVFIQILEASALIVLFIFIRKFEQQKLTLFPVIIMVLISIYYSIMQFYTLPAPASGTTAVEAMMHQLLFTGIPATIYFIVTTIFSVQLFKNQSLTQERNIKLVGMSYIVPFVFSICIVAFLTYIRATEFKYIGLIGELPSLAMINLYLSKLREKENSLPDIG